MDLSHMRGGLHGMKMSRFKGKRGAGGYPTTPNQPSEALAHFMFELAKTVLNKAGGTSSTALFCQANQNLRGPHRALHMCAFQIGLYALGLHNSVSPNWTHRTYSSHVTWITNQVDELGVTALKFIIGTWEGHLTPSEVTSVADKASKSRVPAKIRVGADLALSVLRFAGDLKPNEIQRAIQQCKEDSRPRRPEEPSMLEKACINVENASREGRDIHHDVMFEVARHWYSLYKKEQPSQDDQQVAQQHQDQQQQQHQHQQQQHQQQQQQQQQQVNMLLAVAAQQQQQGAGAANFAHPPPGPPLGHPPPPPPPPLQPFPIPILIPSFPAAAAAAAANQAMAAAMLVTPPPNQQQAALQAAAAAAANPFNQVFNPSVSTAAVAAAAARINLQQSPAGPIFQLNLAPLLPAPPPANAQQAMHQAMIAAAAAGQQNPQAVAAAAAAAGARHGMVPPQGPHGPMAPHHAPHLQAPPAPAVPHLGVDQGGPGHGAIAQANHNGHRYLELAYRVGILALENLGRKLNEDRPQEKFARNPSYGDDVKWLMNQVVCKLGYQSLLNFLYYVTRDILSPFLVQVFY